MQRLLLLKSPSSLSFYPLAPTAAVSVVLLEGKQYTSLFMYVFDGPAFITGR